MVTQESDPRGDATPASSSGAQKSCDEENDAASPSDTGDATDRAASRQGVDEERIKDAVAQHKEDVANIDTDAARLAAIRESDEKTNRRLAAMESKIDDDLAAMKTKIDNLTDMLQALLDKEQK